MAVSGLTCGNFMRQLWRIYGSNDNGYWVLSLTGNCCATAFLTAQGEGYDAFHAAVVLPFSVVAASTS